MPDTNKAVGYFLAEPNMAAQRTIDTFNKMAQLALPDNRPWFADSIKDAHEAEWERGMPKDFPHSVYRVTVEELQEVPGDE